MEGLFHLHSNYSYDGKLSLEELRKECLKRRHNFMIVTEHAEDFDAERVKSYLAECRKLTDRDFVVIPGLEFRMEDERDSHILVIGSEILSVGNADEIWKKIMETETHALTVLAHPSRNGHYIPKNLEGKINGVEIWNAAYDSRYLPSDRAIRLLMSLKSKNSRMVGFGGLDLHDMSGFRDLRIQMIKPCKTEIELLDNLKAGRFKIKGSIASIDSKPEWGFIRMALLKAGRQMLKLADYIRWRLLPQIKTH